MSIETGHPLTQPGTLQFKHLLASTTASCGVYPKQTSSKFLFLTFGSCSAIGVLFHLSFAFSILTSFIFLFSKFASVTLSPSKLFLCSESSFVLKLSIYCFDLDIALSQSTRWPSNSGPSTQANFVFPSTRQRQAPHMPVPSTIIGFNETIVGRLYFLVVRQTNFIIIIGPIHTHWSYFFP